jgi:nitrile hydratase accessory protein
MQNFPHQPQDEQGPVFNEPWEAQAFALVIALHEQELFSWQEWAGVLSEQIALAQAGGDPDLGNTYYQHWLAALETISQQKKLSNEDELMTRKSQWTAAYLNTPHGKPIELSAGKTSC